MDGNWLIEGKGKQVVEESGRFYFFSGKSRSARRKGVPEGASLELTKSQTFWRSGSCLFSFSFLLLGTFLYGVVK